MRGSVDRPFLPSPVFVTVSLFPRGVEAVCATVVIFFPSLPAPCWILVFVFENNQCQETDKQHLAWRRRCDYCHGKPGIKPLPSS